MAGEAPTRSDLSPGAVYRRLARNSAWLAGGTGASALFVMLAVVLSARALSAREFGFLVLFQAATLMLATLMSFSTQQPVIKLGHSAQAAGDTAHLGRIIGLGLLIDALASTVAVIIAFAFLAVGRGWIGLPDEQWGIAAVFACSLLFTGYLTSNGIFRLLNRFDLLSLIQAGSAALVLFACVWLYATRASFEAYCWAWATYYALNSQLPLWMGIHLAKKAGIAIALPKGRLDASEIRTFLAYCWTTWGVATVEAIRSNGDSLLVGAAVSVEAAGVYNVAKQLAGVLRKLNTIYASAAFPEISTLSAHGEHGGAAGLRRRMLWIGLLIGGLAVLVAMFAGRFVVASLFGVHFLSGYLPLVILTAAAAAQLISHTLSMYVQVYAGPERLLYAYLIALVAFAILVAPLTATLSIAGTALAQLIFTLVLIASCQMALRKATHAS